MIRIGVRIYGVSIEQRALGIFLGMDQNTFQERGFWRKGCSLGHLEGFSGGGGAVMGGKKWEGCSTRDDKSQGSAASPSRQCITS